MPSGTHVTELDIPIDKVWDFVSDMNRWAPLVPGYIEHEHSDSQAIDVDV